MQFTVNDISQCSGGNHVIVNVSINGGQPQDAEFTREELLDSPTGIDEIRRAAVLRMRSAVKEVTTGSPTPLQIRNALVGNTFEI